MSKVQCLGMHKICWYNFWKNMQVPQSIKNNSKNKNCKYCAYSVGVMLNNWKTICYQIIIDSLRNMYFKSWKFHAYFPYVLLKSIDQKLLVEYTRLQYAHRRLCSRLLPYSRFLSRTLSNT